MPMSEPLTILEVLERSTEYLKKKGVKSAKCDTEWMLSHVIECSRMDLFLRHGEMLPGEQLNTIRQMVVSRGNRIPLQHILGFVSFAGLSLKCDSRALVPRPETEQLVDLLSQKLGPAFSGRIIDFGTGSGAIILAICSLLPLSSGIGLEKSKAAISLAYENLALSKLEGRVKIIEFDWSRDKLTEKADLVVSNPPYLTLTEWNEAEPEVKIHDPLEALVAQQKGISELLRIIELSKRYLQKDGILALEFGCSHADLIYRELKDFFRVEIHKDWSQRRRFAVGVKI